ncbi:hypothetical protein GRJ22_10035 [Photobacterium carnosum]|nr:hypothetical protein [Photobacterium carnosum]
MELDEFYRRIVHFVDRVLEDRNKYQMSKLFKLKKFVTLEEAKTHLSGALEEQLSVADIYRLALDGHLTISVSFLGIITMSPGRIFEDTANNGSPEMIISKGMAVGEDLKEPYSIIKMSGFPMSLREWLFFGSEIMYADGIWDLSMLGQEYEYIESLYHKEAGGVGGFDGFSGRIKAVVLKRSDSFCKLKDIHRPLGIPEQEVASFIDNAKNNDFFDCLQMDRYPHLLVIKTEELTRFIQSLQDEPEPLVEKPLTTVERNKLLMFTSIFLKELKIDPSCKGITSSISLMADQAGVAISENTIRKYLNQINDITG